MPEIKFAIAGMSAFAAILLSGCATQKITPQDQINLIHAFQAAGCKGDLHASIGGATGQLGGGFHADASVNGDCNPANIPTTVPVTNTVDTSTK